MVQKQSNTCICKLSLISAPAGFAGQQLLTTWQGSSKERGISPPHRPLIINKSIAFTYGLHYNIHYALFTIAAHCWKRTTV